MEQCKRCGSFAINENSHGRDLGKDLHLCDVCYWRKRAEQPSNDVNRPDALAAGEARCGGCGRLIGTNFEPQ